MADKHSSYPGYPEHPALMRERVEGYVFARQQAADFVRSAGHPELAASILLNWAPAFLPPACSSCDGSGDREAFVFTGGTYPEDGGNGYSVIGRCPDCQGEGLDYSAQPKSIFPPGNDGPSPLCRDCGEDHGDKAVAQLHPRGGE